MKEYKLTRIDKIRLILNYLVVVFSNGRFGNVHFACNTAIVYKLYYPLIAVLNYGVRKGYGKWKWQK